MQDAHELTSLTKPGNERGNGRQAATPTGEAAPLLGITTSK
jgi:hypothetical protein